MKYNKVINSNGEVLLDLTGDTVTPTKMLAGVTAHDQYGECVIGEIETYAGELVVTTTTTATLVKGTYVASTTVNGAITTVSSGSWGTQNINFTSNSKSYSSMTINSGLRLQYDNDYAISEDSEGIPDWKNDNFATVILDTDQTVSTEFGEWFNSNFTIQQHNAPSND